MSSTEVRIHFGKPSYSRVPVTIEAPGLPPFTDEVRLASEDSREAFAAKVTEKMPGINNGLLLEQLEAEAARQTKDTGAKEEDAATSADKLQGRTVTFEEPEPWPEAVDGPALVRDIQGLFARYMVLPLHAPLTATLWVVQTYCTHIATVFPYLALQSPEKRCGKTRLLTVLEHLVRRPLSASNATPAAVFRSLEQWQPTLLIDEVDSFLKGDEELRGILNAGHTRGGSVLRAVPVGDDFEARRFAVWGPKILCGIGQLPDTLQDRSIALPLARKGSGETVERLRLRVLEAAAEPPRRKIVRWVADHMADLDGMDPDIPEQLDDRAADCWEPLLAIADLMGLGVEARTAAVALCAGRDEEGTYRVRLLLDIRKVFEERQEDRIASAQLVEALTSLEEAPWADWRHGKGLSVSGLAKLLRDFGIRSSNLRLPGREQRKGYRRTDFEDAWARYCPVVKPPEELSSVHPDRAVPPSPSLGSPPKTRDFSRDATSVHTASESVHEGGGTAWDVRNARHPSHGGS